MKLGKDGGHAILSDNQWLGAIAGTRTPLSRNQLYQVISGRHGNANAAACLGTIVGHTVSSERDGIEAWALKEGILPPQGLALGVLIAPVVTGTLTQGETLTVSQGTWSESPNGYAYQWIRTDSSRANPVAIGGATSSTYVLTSDDAGNKIRAKVTASNAFGSRDYYTPISDVVAAATPPLSVTNVQKLSLSPSSPTDGTTIVAVSDRFVVSGAGSSAVNRFWYPDGTANGKAAFRGVGSNGGVCNWDGSLWIFGDADANYYQSAEDVASPWFVSVWTLADGALPLPTLTHPAIQVLTAPSTVQGGVFVSGGTQDGVYPNGAVDGTGHQGYVGLGAGSTFSIDWTSPAHAASDGFVIYNDGEPTYYSLSAVLTPDLASNWKNIDAIAEQFTVTTTGVTSNILALSNPAAYFTFSDDSGPCYAWIKVTGSLVNTDPAPGGRGIECDISAALTAPQVASALATILNADAKFSASAASNVITVINDLTGTRTDSGAGTSGFAVATTVQGHADTVASITVTSVSNGDLVAGNKLGPVVRAVNGATNGRNKFTDVLGVVTDITWDGSHWSDGTTTGTLNSAFPDIGVADAVASEANWANQ